MLAAGPAATQLDILSGPACAATQGTPGNAAWRRFGSIPERRSRSRRDTIEIVISRHSLAMLHATNEGVFMAKPMFRGARAIATRAVLSLAFIGVKSGTKVPTPADEFVLKYQKPL
jgi:hypothetical protein